MKLFSLLFLCLLSVSARAAIKGAPFIPEEDLRFDALENQVSANAGISRVYAKAVYDVSIQGGGSTATHSLGVVLPAGAVIEKVFVYINKAFTTSGSASSVALQCAGTTDLMYYQDLTLAGLDTAHVQSFPQSNFGTTGSVIPVQAGWTHVDSGASVPSACTVTAVVRSGAISGQTLGGSDMTAGKLTTIIDYFIR